MIHLKHLPVNLLEPVVGRVTYFSVMENNQPVLLIKDKDISKVEGSFSNDILRINNSISFIQNSYESIIYGLCLNISDKLNEGDIVVLKPNGTCNILFKPGSKDNCLFVTERCNSNCLMCPQPPRDIDDINYLQKINEQLVENIPKETELLGITGGEPSLLGDRLFSLIEKINFCLPNTNIDILTNGRAFAWIDNVKRFAEVNCTNLLFSVSLHSDYYLLHDYIAQKSNAFSQTVTGIQNLARYGCRIEIRVVLSLQSISRLSSLAHFIYMNMPFVEQVIFMGLEYTGYTPYNDHLLWIDPVLYWSELDEAISFLVMNGINVSIYNLPLCLLPRHLWKYSVSAISDWKQRYFDKCLECIVRDTCGGAFASSRAKLLSLITPITEE